MGVLSADQVRVFLTIVDQGSFSAAAKVLNRNQSAVSYAVLNLEQQLGVKLFDRQGGRSQLSPAGAALLGDARKATYSLDTMRARAAGIAHGVESKLAIAVDSFCSLDGLADALRELSVRFPMVRPSVHLELVRNALNMMLDGSCTLGIISHPMSSREELDQFPLATTTELAPYVAAHHPLALLGARLENDQTDSYIQFLLGDLHGLNLGQELAIFSSRTWITSDLRAQQALIRAGAGWGFLPAHLAAPDIEAGRLVRIDLAAWPDGGWARVPMMVVRHSDAALGPAATWLLDRLLGDTVA